MVRAEYLAMGISLRDLAAKHSLSFSNVALHACKWEVGTGTRNEQGGSGGPRERIRAEQTTGAGGQRKARAAGERRGDWQAIIEQDAQYLVQFNQINR